VTGFRGSEVVVIAAVAADRVIGRGGALPWRLPADLARFRALTMGHHMIIGRRTWESLEEPLDGRTVVVLSRDSSFRVSGAVVVRSLEAALAVASGDPEIFVGGGSEVYPVALPRADRIELTLVHASFDGDTLFPELDPARWREAAREDHAADAANPIAYSFVTLVPVRLS
jgi:dihydrofolate reductase